MDGIEKITGRIASDAAQEIESIQAEARRQAEEITARYAGQAERESQELLERGRRSAEERVERLASVAQLEALQGPGLPQDLDNGLGGPGAGGDLVHRKVGPLLPRLRQPLGPLPPDPLSFEVLTSLL